VYRVLVENLEERDHLEDQAQMGVKFTMELQGVGCGVLDWIDVAQDRDRRRALVNAVMNPRIP